MNQGRIIPETRGSFLLTSFRPRAQSTSASDFRVLEATERMEVTDTKVNLILNSKEMCKRQGRNMPKTREEGIFDLFLASLVITSSKFSLFEIPKKMEVTNTETSLISNFHLEFYFKGYDYHSQIAIGEQFLIKDIADNWIVRCGIQLQQRRTTFLGFPYHRLKTP